VFKPPVEVMEGVVRDNLCDVRVVEEAKRSKEGGYRR
jgi:hypothetical protein